MLRRTLVGGGLSVALAGLLWLSSRSADGAIVLVAGTLLSALAAYEVGRMGKLAGQGLSLVLMGPVFVVYLRVERLAVGPAESTIELLGTLAALGAGLAVACGAWLGLRMIRAPGPAGGLPLGRALGMTAWIAFPLPALVVIWWNYQVAGLVALILLCKLGDIAGYYVGNAIGKRHPFPSLSPGKTVAGCVASLVVGTLAGAGCVALDLLPEAHWGLAGGLVAGAVVNIAAQAGDLLESRVKRRAEVKDSGTWFGPSGGVLDLVDSLLLGVPAALVVWPLLFDAPGLR